LPPPTMADCDYELFVFILGDSSPSEMMFPITVPANISVGELKDMVYAKKKEQFKGH